MTDLEAVLTGFRDATTCAASVWLADGARPPRRIATAVPAVGSIGWTPPLTGNEAVTVESPAGPVFLVPVPGQRRAWLAVGPSRAPNVSLEASARFLLPVVAQSLQSALEVEHAANELAERYEEINLLYTITEILGRTVSLEEATKTILSEVSETVGARRASVLVADRGTNMLRAVAALGVDPAEVPAISLDDPCSVS